MDILLARHPSPLALALHGAFDALAPPASLAPDLCLVLGGDGTMLAAIHQHGRDRRYLGINCGNLGFLMNDPAGDPHDIARRLLDQIADNQIQEHNFPCLRICWTDAEGDAISGEDFAINDAWIARSTGQTCHLRVVVDGVEVVSRLICDGLIAATPLGSTAYSFSAGGPAAHPRVEALHLTAICPHLPRLSPMVLPPQTSVTVEVRYPDHRPARLSVDGVDRGIAHRMCFNTDLVRLRLCYLPGHNFTATMVRKIVAV